MGKIKTFFTADRQARNPYKKRFSSFFDFIEKFGGILKIGVTALILFLFAADYYTIYDLFREPQFNYDPVIQAILAVVFAAVLEGLPCLFSASLCKLMDTNIKDKIVRRKQKIVFAISLFAIIFLFSLVVYLRVTVLLGSLDPEKQNVFIDFIDILKNTDKSALKQFLDLLSTDKLSANTFLIFSPIITSIFAFLLSLGYTSSTYHDVLRRKYEAANRKSMKATFNKDVVKAKSRTMKQELWNELGLVGTPPDELDDFCDQTYAAIRQNMVNDGIKAFEIQIGRFNLDVISELQSCLIRISECSSIPLEITKLSVKDIIAEYDGSDNNTVAESFDVFSYSKSIQALSNKLRDTMIHNDTENPPMQPIIDPPIPENPITEIISDNIEANESHNEGFGYVDVSAVNKDKEFDSRKTDNSRLESEESLPENPSQNEFDSNISKE